MELLGLPKRGALDVLAVYISPILKHMVSDPVLDTTQSNPHNNPLVPFSRKGH